MTRRAGRRLTEKRKKRKILGTLGSQLQLTHMGTFPSPSPSLITKKGAPGQPYVKAPGTTVATPVPLIEGWPSCRNCGAATASRFPATSASRPPTTATPASLATSSSQQMTYTAPSKQPTAPTTTRQFSLARKPRSPPPIFALPDKKLKPLKLVPIDVPNIDWRWYKSLARTDPRHAVWKTLRLIGTGSADPPTTGNSYETMNPLAVKLQPIPRPKFEKNVIPNRASISTIPSNLGRQWMQSRSRLDLATGIGNHHQENAEILSSAPPDSK